MSELEKHILKERNKVLKYKDTFQSVFGTRINPFWENNILGFDIIKFDKWIADKHGLEHLEHCLKDTVDEFYGPEGTEIILGLIE